jgi:hypothetical protein
MGQDHAGSPATAVQILGHKIAGRPVFRNGSPRLARARRQKDAVAER